MKCAMNNTLRTSSCTLGERIHQRFIFTVGRGCASMAGPKNIAATYLRHYVLTWRMEGKGRGAKGLSFSSPGAGHCRSSMIRGFLLSYAVSKLNYKTFASALTTR